MAVRAASIQDLDDIIRLCREHASFEGSSYDSSGQLQALKEYLFGQNKVLNCIVVQEGSDVVGYATFMKQFSTWDGQFYVYMDCLFLNEGYRGKGYGVAMVQHIKEYAQMEGCPIIQWQTPAFNKTAIAFYKKLGAISRLKERFFWSV